MDTYGFYLRTYHRVVKVAQTIAYLSSFQRIEEEHLAEALQFKIRAP